MTKTTNTLVDLSTRFDALRPDGRGAKKDAGESDRGAGRAMFASLVREGDGKVSGAKETAAVREGATQDATERLPEAGKGKPELAEILVVGDGARSRASEAGPGRSNSMTRQEAMVMDDGAAPSENTDAETRSQRAQGESADLHRSQARGDGMDTMTLTESGVAEGGRQRGMTVAETTRSMVAGGTHETGDEAPTDAYDLTKPRNAGVPNEDAAPGRIGVPAAAGNEAQAAHEGDTADDEKVAVRQPHGAASSAGPQTEPRQHVAVAHETEGRAATEHQRQDAAGGESGRPQSVPVAALTGSATVNSGTGTSAPSRMSGHADGGVAAASKAEARDPRPGQDEGIQRQAGAVRPEASERTPAQGRPEAWAVPVGIRHAPGLHGTIPRGVADRDVGAPDRPTGRRAPQGERTTMQSVVVASDERPPVAPELRARRVFESANVQRSLDGNERTQAATRHAAERPLLRPVAVQPRESIAPATPPAVPGAGANFGLAGQVVDGMVDADGMPRTGAELKASMMRPGVGAAPEPLKVLQVQLRPEHLGVVTVRMTLVGDRLELRVLTARQATAELLQGDRRLLVDALQQRNFDVEAVTIQYVEHERGGSTQASPQPGAGARAGQGDSFAAGSEGQASRQGEGAERQHRGSEPDRPEQPQDVGQDNVLGTRRGIYL